MPSLPIPAALAVAVYLTIWFTVLFAVLPIGVHSQSESGEVIPGTDPGAPVAPRLLLKIGLTTLLSFAVFILLVVVLRLVG